MQANQYFNLLNEANENLFFNNSQQKQVFDNAAIVASKKFGAAMCRKFAVDAAADAICSAFPKKFQREALVVKQCGPLFNSMRTVYNRAWKTTKEAENPETETESEDELNEDEMKVLVQKINRIDRSKKKEILIILKKTAKFRTNLLKTEALLTRRNSFFDCFEEFPFEFIGADFSYRYGPAKSNKIQEYEKISPHFNKLVNNKGNPISKYIQSIPKLFQPAATLLQLLGHRPVKVNKGEKMGSFKAALEKLIYEQPWNEIVNANFRCNSQPHLVFQTNGTDYEFSLIVNLEANCTKVLVLGQCSFEKALDLWFKVTHLFEFHYDPELVRFGRFLETYVYEIHHHEIPNNIKVHHNLMLLAEAEQSKYLKLRALFV